MSEHTHNWQVGEEGAVVCLECAAVVGANDFIESLQAENAKLRKVADAAAKKCRLDKSSDEASAFGYYQAVKDVYHTLRAAGYEV